MKTFWFNLLFFLCLSLFSKAQTSDTIQGFKEKIKGEEIIYYSPLHEFANTALLTRMNGKMPIEWHSPTIQITKEMVTYSFLIGHSSGTSKANRHFTVSLNDQYLFTIETPMQQKGSYVLKGESKNGATFHFNHLEYDDNGDAFGRLYMTVPANMVNEKARFSILGQNEESNDWLMVFMYKGGLKSIVEATNLITRDDNKRQMNIYADVPYREESKLEVNSKYFHYQGNVKFGYNKIGFPSYSENFTGKDDLILIFNERDTVLASVEVHPVRPFTFHLIHHSHNDIGYSHLQTEVEKIQNNNIRMAIKWVEDNKNSSIRPIWHIESLWAVENFMSNSTDKEKRQLIALVKKGNIVLSANYANILTGISRKEELNWVLEYAKSLEKQYGISIQNAMMTDIPGITHSGLSTYIRNNIPYLSLGPNYVEAFADHGDRVGGVIQDQGDKIFYWKETPESNEKLLIWTAGKGYSFFHSIKESEKQQKWEQRLSNYVHELNEKNYPFTDVQLRYTKKADNGPVDTSLIHFVKSWNEQFKSPTLVISSVNELFKEFEKKYEKEIPILSGEISPYWEDGAYSTAVEEIENRELVLKTIALEKEARKKNKYSSYEKEFYRLHRNLILFHEHTWGAWCSISDPEIPFTTEQWAYKKAFLDSARVQYARLAQGLQFTYKSELQDPTNLLNIADFEIDPIHGGLNAIWVEGINIVSDTASFSFFEPIYNFEINPSIIQRSKVVAIQTIQDDSEYKIIEVIFELTSLRNAKLIYTLSKSYKTLTCKVEFDKEIVKNKESLHLALPYQLKNPSIHYGPEGQPVEFNGNQLPGSNKEFICSESDVLISSESLNMYVHSPSVNLFEVGNIIDETRVNGAKVWKRSNDNTSALFLYVLNNYWHTNYKAYQDGHFNFDVSLSFELKK